MAERQRQARQLIADLLAAGCSFAIDADGYSVQIRDLHFVTPELWPALLSAGHEFTEEAREQARWEESIRRKAH